MSGNSRYTVALHVLTWMALAARRGRHLVTSEQIANSVNTNPVFIRRVLGLLREAGLVVARRGAGAGWRLAAPPEQTTLDRVYDAVAAPDEPLFALHHGTPNLECPVGRGIRPVLRGVYDGAERALRAELARVTLSDLLVDTLAESAGG